MSVDMNECHPPVAPSLRRLMLLAPPMVGSGGSQRYIETLEEAFRTVALGAEVTVVAMRPLEAGRSRFSRAAIKGHFVLQVLRELLRRRPDLVLCTHVAVSGLGWLWRILG